MWLGIETGILTDGSKYFDNLVGQIEKPDSLSASAAEKKRAADGILEISIWKREIERGKEAKKAGRRSTLAAIENLVNSKMDNRLRTAAVGSGNPPWEHAWNCFPAP